MTLDTKITSVVEKYNTRMREYEEFKKEETVLEARASVYWKNIADELEKIPKDLLVAVDLLPSKDFSEMSFEEISEYTTKVYNFLNNITDVLDKYLDSKDINTLVGYEDFFQIDKQGKQNPVVEKFVNEADTSEEPVQIASDVEGTLIEDIFNEQTFIKTIQQNPLDTSEFNKQGGGNKL